MRTRREAITLLGGAAAAWPLAARAQQRRLPAIGFLHDASPAARTDELSGFHRGLKEVEFVEGENVAIVYRWAEGQLGRLPALMVDLFRHLPAVIVVNDTTAPAARAATRSVPIVLVSFGDPIEAGRVPGQVFQCGAGTSEVPGCPIIDRLAFADIIRMGNVTGVYAASETDAYHLGGLVAGRLLRAPRPRDIPN